MKNLRKMRESFHYAALLLATATLAIVAPLFAHGAVSFGDQEEVAL